MAADVLSSSPKRRFCFTIAVHEDARDACLQVFRPMSRFPELSIWRLCTPGKGFHHQTLQIQLPRLDAHQTQQISGNDKLPRIVQQDSFLRLRNLPCVIERTNIYSLGGFLTFICLCHLFASPAALSENMKPCF